MTEQATDRRYSRGFGNQHSSEAVDGAVPRSQNSPLETPLGLYAEQVSGSVFVTSRQDGLRSWLYRIRPSVGHGDFAPLPHVGLVGDFRPMEVSPNLHRWKPRIWPGDRVDFLDSLTTLGGSGDATGGAGFALHLYAATADMQDRCFYDVDGDLLLIAELGRLDIQTELGWLLLGPGEIAILPRGLKYRVTLPDGRARGYLLEVFDGPYRLPDRGLIGANGLADERHFLAPVATYEDRDVSYRVAVKSGGKLYETTQAHSPFDVVGWHGSYAPFKYDLAMFNAMGTVTFDHPDPSIFTVIGCPRSAGDGSAADLIVFPPRWEVAEHTFRPPYFHRNRATEINGVIHGGDPTNGFESGCTFLTPQFAAHGIGPESVEKSIGRMQRSPEPRRISDEQLWFQFESVYPMQLTDWARGAVELDPKFAEMFRGHARRFEAR